MAPSAPLPLVLAVPPLMRRTAAGVTCTAGRGARLAETCAATDAEGEVVPGLRL